ncbi:hypothetical protein [Planktotalea sp.]|uniref:hypothetical protein n=1 Tax=Planktotalea sp. TaxID=2029877 RepID=UPI0025E7DE08|nr:hypothetical protein [Planktotalea sp.]
MRADKPDFNISELANEILNSKTAQHLGADLLSWECNHLNFIDFKTVRIALQDIPSAQDRPNIVCVAVGTIPGEMLPHHIDSAPLARELVKRITELVDANAVLWNVPTQPLCPEVMDDFQHELDSMLRYLDVQLKTAQHAAKKRIPGLNTSFLKDADAFGDLRTDLRNTHRVGDVHMLHLRTSMFSSFCSFLSARRHNALAVFSSIWTRAGVDKPHSSTQMDIKERCFLPFAKVTFW